ncbi:shikimate kinase [Dermabacter sp. p3-SID358]|uniref:shikimate kinase n=1 Tax=Dermabacter sp. p3-SID358 TaxID=2916114 RepID=UPI0021A7A860|nr:shikimate kinase [Dermabacter sp. p3-SID358]MCT1866121.1 shikimate kinase [Dermabacter sp. p3-SID358]
MSPDQGTRLTRLRAVEFHEQGPRLVLVGPMGAGKSTVGRLVATALDVPFLDSDAEIEREAGQAIPEIFAERGEEHFRVLEERVIARLLAEHDGVLALGGGAVTTPATRARLNRAPVVRLVLDPALAKKRIGNGKGRPVLAGEDPLARWIKVSREREPFFAEVSTWALDTNDISPEELASTLVRELCRR